MTSLLIKESHNAAPCQWQESHNYYPDSIGTLLVTTDSLWRDTTSTLESFNYCTSVPYIESTYFVET